jgi:hypothetical protein
MRRDFAGGTVSGRFYPIPVIRFRRGLKRVGTAGGRPPGMERGCWEGRVAVSWRRAEPEVCLQAQGVPAGTGWLVPGPSPTR